MSEAALRDRFERTLADSIADLALVVPDDAIARLGQHYELLVRWARRINLTTVTDPVAAAHRHALDSLLFAVDIPLDARWATVDVGSGGGFPGVVLAVARPELSMTLLEPIRKRTSFLRVVVAELGLARTRVVDGKLQREGGPPAAGFPAELIVSRATVPPLDLIAVAAPALAPGGRLITTGGQGMPTVDAVIAVARASGLHHVGRRAHTLPDGALRWLDELRRPRDAEDEHG